MGQLLAPGGLTTPNSAVMQNGDPNFIGNPQQTKGQFYQQSINRMGQEHPNEPALPNAPTIGTPSYQQAASAGATPGGANAMSPGLNKAGKLMTILSSGLQGALAGRAANEEATVQSGGRRSGGAGMGFQAGYQLPWQREQALQGLAQQKAQTGLLQAEQGNVNIPGVGVMPAWLAKSLGPAGLAAQSRMGVAQTAAQSREQVAQTNKRFVTVPNVGLYDTQQGTMIPGSQQGIVVTPDIANDYNLPQQFVGKPMKLSDLSSMERAQSYQNVIAQGANGPSLVNRNPASPDFGQAKNLGIGAPAMSGIVPVAADPNNPSNITYVPKTTAVRQGMAAPSSGPTQAAKSTLKSATSGAIAAQSTAFQTALQHANLLEQAARALANGDQRTLNSLKNAFKTQFGSPDVTNFQTIAQAYSDEVQKMLSSGHITEGEQKMVSGNIPSNASPQQILGAINAYKALATSKMNILQQQTQRGLKGQTNFPSNYTPPVGAPTASGPGGHKIVVDGGRWVDAATGQPIQ